MNMRKHLAFLTLALACAASSAAVPPPEKLLPRETMLVFSVPDAPKYWSTFDNSTYGRIWNDPAMKPFRDNFWSKLESDLVGPVDQQFGIKLSDCGDLARGQLTFALVRNESDFEPLLLVDSKDRSEKLKTMLADARKKWIAAGKQLKTEQIHGVEFATFISTGGEFSNSFKGILPDNKSAKDNDKAEDSGHENEKIQILVGQSESLLVVGHSKAVIEKVLALQAGGLASALDQEPLFQADFGSKLRDAGAFVWLNSKAIFSKASDEPSDSSPTSINPKALISATGLSSLNTVSCTWRDTGEGFVTEFFMRVPESERVGLFKALFAGAKESSPPPFVPADAIKFIRWRLDLPETWNTLESLLGKMNPGAKDAINFMLNSAGKARDEKYDLRAELLGALGNDVITYQKAPRADTQPASAPSIFLIGSPKPELLASTIRVAAESLVPGSDVKEADFLGRKLFSLAGAGSAQPLNFSASGGYLAFSTDRAILEEYLRGTDDKSKPLGATPGLPEAAQKVGGMGTGLFGYNNQAEELRLAFDQWHKAGPAKPAAGKTGAEKGFNITELFDMSLLPQFDAVSKYFSFSVYAGRSTADGYVVTFYAPNRRN